MKNYKRILFLLLAALIVCVSLSFLGCAQKYRLTVEGASDLLIKKLNGSYSAGQTVTVKVELLMDADVIVTLDGETIERKNVTDENGHYTHWEYSFTMPEHDATLHIRLTDGFLP